MKATHRGDHVHLFLDTNTYLGFFRLSDDNLDQLKKLSERVGSGETTLYVTEQVRAEFLRNRESTIDEALDTVRKAPTLPNQFAHLFEALNGYEEVRSALKDTERKLRKLMEDAIKAVADGSLHADEIIIDLFARGKSVDLTDAILEAAKLRVLLGNPPGKAGSYGDAVNWESLLLEVPDDEDLVLVTNDRDYKSKLDLNRLNEYLIDEWTRKKGSQIHLHGTLRSALEAHYPEIQLAPEPEPEQDQAIDRLVNANNFSTTHRAIRRLSRFDEFTSDQVAALVEAANSNSQVRGIMEDDDVFEFYDSLARQYGSLIESALWDRLNDRLKDAEIYRSTLA
jgi:predicted nucleic acid-binding protein